MDNYDKIIKEAADYYVEHESKKIRDIPEATPSLKFRIKMWFLFKKYELKNYIAKFRIPRFIGILLFFLIFIHIIKKNCE